MKAYLIAEFGLNKLATVDLDIPRPAPDEVLVKIEAVALNYRDHMVVTGTYNPKMKLPAVPLSDGAGSVIEVGSDVSEWKVGDRVMPIFAQRWFDGPPDADKRRSSLGAGALWDGVLREFAVFRADALVRVPDHLSFAEASTLPCAAVTAWNALMISGRLRAGETVLTLGTGGVSVFAIQLAHLAGARVFSTSGSDAKIERLRELGVDGTVNYREYPEWNATVLEMTDGHGVDHVIEVGGAGTFGHSLKAVRMGGHVALIGALSGGGSVDPMAIFMRSVRVQGIFVGSKAMFIELLRAVEVAKLKPVIDRTFGFEEAREAIEYLASGSHFGKVVITMP